MSVCSGALRAAICTQNVSSASTPTQPGTGYSDDLRFNVFTAERASSNMDTLAIPDGNEHIDTRADLGRICDLETPLLWRGWAYAPCPESGHLHAERLQHIDPDSIRKGVFWWFDVRSWCAEGPWTRTPRFCRGASMFVIWRWRDATEWMTHWLWQWLVICDLFVCGGRTESPSRPFRERKTDWHRQLCVMNVILCFVDWVYAR